MKIMNVNPPALLVIKKRCIVWLLMTSLLNFGCESERSTTSQQSVDVAFADLGTQKTDAMTTDTGADAMLGPDADRIWDELRAQIEASSVASMAVMFGDASGTRFVHEKSAQGSSSLENP